jgi:hypothetical protein
MWGVLVCGDCLMAGQIIVALVQAEVLRQLFGRPRPIHHDGLQSGRQELAVLDIGSSDRGDQGAARRFH